MNITNNQLKNSNSMNSIRKQAIRSYIDSNGKRCIIIPRGVSGTNTPFQYYQDNDYLLNNIKIMKI